MRTTLTPGNPIPLILQARDSVTFYPDANASGSISIPSQAVLQALTPSATYSYSYTSRTELVVNLSTGTMDVVVAPLSAGAGAVSQTVTLLSNATATGSWMDWNGSGGTQGTVTITCAGWNSANATLQYSLDGGTTPIAAGQYCSWSANGNGNFRLPTCKLRIAISGAVPSAGVYATAAS